MALDNMVYEWKSNARIKASPEAAAKVFDRLERTGGLTPRRLVEESRPEGSVLHNEFEWDDGKAAENYRESQARHLIRCLVVAKEDGENVNLVRAYFPVTEATQYTNINVVLAKEDLREKMLERAKAEMLAFRRKYYSLSELQPVFESIERVTRTKEVAIRDTV